MLNIIPTLRKVYRVKNIVGLWAWTKKEFRPFSHFILPIFYEDGICIILVVNLIRSISGNIKMK